MTMVLITECTIAEEDDGGPASRAAPPCADRPVTQEHGRARGTS